MIMPGQSGDAYVLAGGQSGEAERISMALIEAAGDRNSDVCDAVRNSLVELGKHKPELVLASCVTYMRTHSSMNTPHRIIILNTIEKVVLERPSGHKFTAVLGTEMLQLCCEELTKAKEVVPDWQGAASAVIVAVARLFPAEAMELLRAKIQPGVLPHFFTVKTLGDVAVANVYGCVPYLTEILGVMLPMLGMCKHDNMRWAFANALLKFSESIEDYLANLEAAPDPTVRADMYAQEIYSAYTLLFGDWMNSKDARLRMIIVEAIGAMSELLGAERLEEQLPKLVPSIMSLYKRPGNPHHITQGLGLVLQSAVNLGCKGLETLLDPVISIIFPQVCHAFDYNYPTTIKNHNELLRCFAVLTPPFSDRIIGFLLQKLEASNDRVKIGSLAAIRHLINSCEASLSNKKSLIISGVKLLVNDPSNKVAKSLAQTVSAMAHHGYLQTEGGRLMVDFVVKKCSLVIAVPESRPADPEWVSNAQLKAMCDNLLYSVASTIEGIDAVLWPYLLELLLAEAYTPGCRTICRSLAHIARSKLDSDSEEVRESYYIEFETDVNLPRPHAILVRLLVLVGRPLNGTERGEHVLNCMLSLAGNLHRDLPDLWHSVIPKLLIHLEATENDESYDQRQWEDLILKLLSTTVDDLDSEELVGRLGEEMVNQLNLYKSYPEEKNFLFKLMGIIMRKLNKKATVASMLSTLLSSCKHGNELESEGCSYAFGLASSCHLDQSLEALENALRKIDTQSGKKGFLAFGKDKSSGEPGAAEALRATVVLSYGRIATFSPTSLLTSRWESCIHRIINPIYLGAKDLRLRLSLVRTSSLLAQSFHPAHLGSPFSFSQRTQIIEYILGYIKLEPTQFIANHLCETAFEALKHLVRLEPPLPEAERFDLIKTCVDQVFAIPPGGGVPPKGKTIPDGPAPKELRDAAVESLNELLVEILRTDLNSEGFLSILKHLERPWMTSDSVSQRCDSLRSLYALLTAYRDAMSDVGDFSVLATVLARMVPRSTDTELEIRQLAVDCVQRALNIQLQCQGSLNDPMVDAMPVLKERLARYEPNVLFSVVSDLSKVVAKKLPGSMLVEFLTVLFDGLLDIMAFSGNAACVVLNGVLKARGGEVYNEVGNLVYMFHEKLSLIEVEQTKSGTLHAFRTLASNHLVQVISCLYSFNLPFDSVTLDIWKFLAKDQHIVQGVVDHVVELFATSQPYEMKHPLKSRGSSVPLTKYCPTNRTAAILGLTVLFQSLESEVVLLDNFHKLYSLLVLNIGHTVGSHLDAVKSTDNKKQKKLIEPSSAAVDALREFLTAAKCSKIIDHLDKEDVWDKLGSQEEFCDGVNVFASCLCIYEPRYVAKVVGNLNAVFSSLYDVNRQIVATFFAELINQRCGGDHALVELLLNNLIGRLVDPDHMVRRMCVRGLGNLASMGQLEVAKSSTTVLSSLMAAIDDRDDANDAITLEAIRGLSRIAAQIDEPHVRPILVNLCLRARPIFERDLPEVRGSAIRLFGDLSRFSSGPSTSSLLDQVHSNLVSILLHLNDSDNQVRIDCKETLRKLGPLLDSASVNGMFQKHLLEDGNLHYGEFINDLTKQLIQDFPDRLNLYVMGAVTFFRSTFLEIQCNSVIFVGFYLGNLPRERHHAVTKEHVIQALIELLKSQSSSVRVATAESLSLLWNY